MDAGPIEALAAAQTLISMPAADIQATLLPIACEHRADMLIAPPDILGQLKGSSVILYGFTLLSFVVARVARYMYELIVESLSARARPCVRHERAGYLQRLEITYRHAVRTAGELRIELSRRAGVDRQDHRHRPGRRHRRTHAQARGGAPAQPSAVAVTIVGGNRASKGRGLAGGGLF